MTILWEVSESQPNPFEAIAGDLTEYVVHYASSESTTENNVISELHECIDRAIDMFDINIVPDSHFFLITWDEVYSSITLTVADYKMERESTHVIKFSFLGIDSVMRSVDEARWEFETSSYALKVKGWLTEYLNEIGRPPNCDLVAAFCLAESEKPYELL